MTTGRVDCARPLAFELVGAVHAGDKKIVGEVIAMADLPALAVVLAAMVDQDRPMKDLLGWADDRQPRQLPPRHGGLQPCGTHAAYVRHKARGEDVDDLCVLAEREYQRNRPGRRAGARTPEARAAAAS